MDQKETSTDKEAWAKGKAVYSLAITESSA